VAVLGGPDPSAGRILVVNAGSSSLKLRVLEPDDRLAASADLPAPRGRVNDAALAEAVRAFGRVDAVGHRIVHGGTRFAESIVLDRAVEDALRALTDLAPLHQPKSLAALAAVDAVLPDVPAVACFDTAFHAGIPPAASTYALPSEWRKRWDLRRFGFHGLSHAYASRRAAEMLARPVEGLRVVTCHLGAGASLAAVRDGRSVDTTMGFTPLEGLVMATRSGTVDPGLVLWLEEHVGMPPAELAATLEHRSGLLGLAGTADMREILEAADAGDPESTLARDVYVHRLRGSIATMAASLGGLDALVFTGGVGERAPRIRELAVLDRAVQEIELDPEANADARPDCEIGAEVPGCGRLS
jgi:acetate kinase